MRIAFMGTPDFAVAALDRLVAAGHEMAAVYTQPPRPAGRGKQLQPSPVQKEAEIRGIPVRCPLTLKDLEAQADFAALEADVAVVAAYGLILPQAVLDAPREGCLNVTGWWALILPPGLFAVALGQARRTAEVTEHMSAFLEKIERQPGKPETMVDWMARANVSTHGPDWPAIVGGLLLLWLMIELARAGTDGANRFGPAPG